MSIYYDSHRSTLGILFPAHNNILMSNILLFRHNMQRFFKAGNTNKRTVGCFKKRRTFFGKFVSSFYIIIDSSSPKWIK